MSAPTATQTQQEPVQLGSAEARGPPRRARRAGAAGQRRLLETLPQTGGRGAWAGVTERGRESAAPASSGAAAEATVPPTRAGPPTGRKAALYWEAGRGPLGLRK